MANTNRISDALGFVPDTRVILYKEPGPAPERVQEYRAMSYMHADDEPGAKLLIDGDGWHRTTQDAHAAYVEASAKPQPKAEAKPAADPSPGAPAWPAAEAIPAIMADLARKSKDDVVQYAGSLGIPLAKNLNVPQMLEAIKAGLTAGPAA